MKTDPSGRGAASRSVSLCGGIVKPGLYPSNIAGASPEPSTNGRICKFLIDESGSQQRAIENAPRCAHDEVRLECLAQAPEGQLELDALHSADNVRSERQRNCSPPRQQTPHATWRSRSTRNRIARSAPIFRLAKRGLIRNPRYARRASRCSPSPLVDASAHLPHVRRRRRSCPGHSRLDTLVPQALGSPTNAA